MTKYINSTLLILHVLVLARSSCSSGCYLTPNLNGEPIPVEMFLRLIKSQHLHPCDKKRVHTGTEDLNFYLNIQESLFSSFFFFSVLGDTNGNEDPLDLF